MKKDYVEIIDSNSYIKKCEVIIRFYSEDNDTHYIVYKDNEDYYAAKYDDKVGLSKMNTSLDKEELDNLEKLLNCYIGEKNEEIIGQ